MNSVTYRFANRFLHKILHKISHNILQGAFCFIIALCFTFVGVLTGLSGMSYAGGRDGYKQAQEQKQEQEQRREQVQKQAQKQTQRQRGGQRQGWYGGLELGITTDNKITNPSSDTDVPTNCDQHFAPTTIPDPDSAGETLSLPIPLTNPTCQRGDSWENSFDLDTAALFGLTAGYDWGAVRLELEYLRHTHSGGYSPLQNVVSIASDTSKDSELVVQGESVTDFRNEHFSLNVYYDFQPLQSHFMPYIGLGVGITDIEFAYSAQFIRNSDASVLRAAGRHPGAAGTATLANHKLSDELMTWQFMLGLDYPLTERVLPGVKLRYVRFEDKFSDGREWDLLRGHASTIAPGTAGGDPVRYRFQTDDLDFWSVGFSVKYLF